MNQAKNTGPVVGCADGSDQEFQVVGTEAGADCSCDSDMHPGCRFFLNSKKRLDDSTIQLGNPAAILFAKRTSIGICQPKTKPMFVSSSADNRSSTQFTF